MGKDRPSLVVRKTAKSTGGGFAQSARYRAALPACPALRAADDGSSPCLAREGLQAHGRRCGPGGVLLAPMRDAAGELRNPQTGEPAHPGYGGPDVPTVRAGRKPGACHLVGQPEGAAWLLAAGGCTPAAGCHEATGRPTPGACAPGACAPGAVPPMAPRMPPFRAPNAPG